ncbi:hypothetical protein [Nonomuraea sp. WAC 01424]|uniref:hypothetical protein n=1 Tax=Nonomuraea sp. WAC 01424 TaxID=2203200 RepID=UPI000F7AD378|nr:hypothetical protein [Nonomuraea sp. WAC 01424]
MTMLVLLVTASTVTAGPAVRADAVTDPASAIQRRLVPGHGVRIVSLSDPATLRAVLATTTSRRPAGMYDGVRTTVHEGVGLGNEGGHPAPTRGRDGLVGGTGRLTPTPHNLKDVPTAT